MESGREALDQIKRQVARLEMWTPAELDRYATQLEALSIAFPNPHGAEVACAKCSQRLVISVQPVTRDSSSTHCPRTPSGHVPVML